MSFAVSSSNGTARRFSQIREGGKAMKMFRLCDKEVIETTGVFEFADGAVTISERETHELYRPEMPSPTRLIIGEAIERTMKFISKARSDFDELNAVLKELAVH